MTTTSRIPIRLALGLCLFSLTFAAEQKEKPQLHKRSPQDAARIQAQLIKQVGHELRMLPYFSVFDNLAYRVDVDKVTLLGQVVRGSLKDDAEYRVKKLEAVSSVDNKIEVLPASFNDDRLRQQLFRSIYGSSVLRRYANQPVPPIHIIVKGGHVALEGVVATPMEKNVAGIQANSVGGVFSVVNNLLKEKSK